MKSSVMRRVNFNKLSDLHRSVIRCLITLLFEKADQAVNFRSPGSPPLRLVQEFTIWTLEQGEVHGTYTLVWVDADRWREEFALPDYQEVHVGGHPIIRRLESRPIPPLAAMRARSLVKRMTLSATLQNWHVEKTREEQEGQMTAKCVSLSLGEWTDATYCFDPDQGYPLSSNTKMLSDEKTTAWSDYLNLGGHWIPRVTREFQKGVLIAQNQIKDASLLSSFDPALFSPPAGAEQMEGCGTAEYPKPIRRAEPPYPSAEKANRVEGTVTLFVRIDRQGKAETVGILESLDAGLEQSAMQTVKEWRYKPASCGGNPIPMEMEVQINFKLL